MIRSIMNDYRLIVIFCQKLLYVFKIIYKVLQSVFITIYEQKATHHCKKSK